MVNQSGDRKLIAHQVHAVVGDEFSVRKRLNQIAEEYSQYGYHVSRGSFGSVEVNLPDSRIFFMQDEGVITEHIYRC